MWTAGAIGVATGCGYYSTALALTAFVFIVLTVLSWVSHRLPPDESACEHSSRAALPQERRPPRGCGKLGDAGTGAEGRGTGRDRHPGDSRRRRRAGRGTGRA